MIKVAVDALLSTVADRADTLVDTRRMDEFSSFLGGILLWCDVFRQKEQMNTSHLNQRRAVFIHSQKANLLNEEKEMGERHTHTTNVNSFHFVFFLFRKEQKGSKREFHENNDEAHSV